jgi:hypothetical protein
LLCTTLAGIGYLITGMIGRLAAPWAPRKPRP